MGTPDFAVPTLAALIEAGHEIAAVYSQPPRPAGRGMAERLTPVHHYALTHNLEVHTPLSLKSAEEQKAFAGLAADAAIVVAYGLILPKPILDAPRKGCFNVHASLLPRWRGAAPIQRAIMAGDAETGITIMRMAEGLDTGPICLQGRGPILPSTTAGQLHDSLMHMGAALMVEALKKLKRGGLDCSAQPDQGVTYAQKIDKAESEIDFARPAIAVRNHIHALSPFPGAWFLLAQEGRTFRIKVHRCEVVEGQGEPGEVIDGELTIACGDQAVRFLSLQREGKSAMGVKEFLRGFSVPKGVVVG
ncbi:methionyl-tRNA formyltransferase [Taklimakanibacter deserti]|uniref:methionyl-tRNA formyltransferase n=1 Tax=Taklimakanibacter deserti TaxID=2267839 RepID=UPI0034D4E9E6